MAIKSFKDLEVWQYAMDFTKQVYAITKQLPASERYGLASQLQRAAVSIPSNIAEGSKRTSRADFCQFCRIALGSAAEAETQLLLMADIYPAAKVQDSLEQIERIEKMLTILVSSLSKTINHKPKTIN
jgi:four helix bundle protein